MSGEVPVLAPHHKRGPFFFTQTSQSYAFDLVLFRSGLSGINAKMIFIQRRISKSAIPAFLTVMILANVFLTVRSDNVLRVSTRASDLQLLSLIRSSIPEHSRYRLPKRYARGRPTVLIILPRTGAGEFGPMRSGRRFGSALA